jgi:SAM-dependent methyltransferase
MNNIDQILNKFNLNGSDDRKYVNKMESFKEGRKFLDLIDKVQLNGAENSDWKKIYNTMSKNIQVSELVTSYANSMIYKEMLIWFYKQNYNPSSFIELGCNNGMFSYTLRELWGDVEIIGIDYALHAIKAAKKLALKYKINNYSFFHQDINNPFIDIPKADIIIAPFFFHEISFSKDTNWKIINDNLATISNKSTQLITINRFPDPQMECNQLKLNLINFTETKKDEIKIISHLEDWDTERFPIQVFSFNPFL